MNCKPARREVRGAQRLAPRGCPAAGRAGGQPALDAGGNAGEGVPGAARPERRTIRAAHLGFVASARVPTRDGDRWFRTSGVTIPWFDGGRLALVKVRQPPGSRPSYIEAFRDRPHIFPGFDEIEPGLPLVIVEGELDALVLGQDLHRAPGLAAWASVITLGSAANLPEPPVLAKLITVGPWYLALDADAAGDKAASLWPPRASAFARPRASRTGPN